MFCGQGLRLIRIFNGIVGAGNGGHFGAARELRPAVFEPSASMASAEGPMKVMPASAHARGSAGFSARKP